MKKCSREYSLWLAQQAAQAEDPGSATLYITMFEELSCDEVLAEYYKDVGKHYACIAEQYNKKAKRKSRKERK